jgi:tetratricopeptide (TPR) repeat protein
MKHSKLLLALFIIVGLTFYGSSCGSTELTSARLYISQKNFDKALEVLQKEVIKNPKSDEGYFLLGQVQGEKGDYKAMTESFNKSLDISSIYKKEIDSFKKYYWAQAFNKGVSNFQRGNKSADTDSVKILYDKSVADFENALMIEPDSADTYKNLALIYLSKGDNEGAIKPLQELINREKALDGYKFLGEIYSVNGANLKNQGKDAESVTAYNKSIEVLEEGLKYHPNNAELLVTLSTSYIGAGRSSEAIDKYKKLVEVQPNEKNIRYNYGVLLLTANDFAGAETQFKEALVLDPAYENASYNLGVTYVKWGSFLSKEADEKGTNSDEFKEKYRAALPYLEKTCQTETATSQNWEILGKVYGVLGMTKEAEQAFKKADEMRKNGR